MPYLFWHIVAICKRTVFRFDIDTKMCLILPFWRRGEVLVGVDLLQAELLLLQPLGKQTPVVDIVITRSRL